LHDVTWWAWGALALFTVVTFFFTGLWALTGWQGAASEEPHPVLTTIALTAIAGGIMWWLGVLP